MNRNIRSEEKSEVADVISQLLWFVDHKEWSRALSLFGPAVEVDYTSLSGGFPSVQSSEELVSGWKKFLPGFDKTQHLAGPITVAFKGNKASARCAITATHTLGKEKWIVGGHYDIGLEFIKETWNVVRMRLETSFIDGNTDLPRMATERLGTTHL